MKILLILTGGLAGLFFTVKHFIKNLSEIRQRSHATTMDKFFNYPLMVIWFLYLILFFCGFIVNNLFF